LPRHQLKRHTLDQRRKDDLRLHHGEVIADADVRPDLAVLDAYGWPHDLSDEEILSRLLALNLERAARQGNHESPDAQASTKDSQG
jgi:hypothetical protein